MMVIVIIGVLDLFMDERGKQDRQKLFLRTSSAMQNQYFILETVGGC